MKPGYASDAVHACAAAALLHMGDNAWKEWLQVHPCSLRRPGCGHATNSHAAAAALEGGRVAISSLFLAQEDLVARSRRISSRCGP